MAGQLKRHLDRRIAAPYRVGRPRTAPIDVTAPRAEPDSLSKWPLQHEPTPTRSFCSRPATMYQTTLSSAHTVRCEAQTQPQQPRQPPAAVPQRRRLLLAGLGAAALALPARPAAAAFPGIESIDLPAVDVPAAIAEKQARNQAVLDAAEESFQNSGERCWYWEVLLPLHCKARLAG